MFIIEAIEMSNFNINILKQFNRINLKYNHEIFKTVLSLKNRRIKTYYS
jgi:hypothetical protein